MLELLGPCHRVQVPVLTAVSENLNSHVGVVDAVEVLTRLGRVGATECVVISRDVRDCLGDVTDDCRLGNAHATTSSLKLRKRIPDGLLIRCEVRHRVQRGKRCAEATGGNECLTSESAPGHRRGDDRLDLPAVGCRVTRELKLLGELGIRASHEVPLRDARSPGAPAL